MHIRRFRTADAQPVSALISRALRETCGGDYTGEYIDELMTRMRAEDMLVYAAKRHFYVACDESAGDKIAGCGAIAPLTDRAGACMLYNIFVLPEYQGRGVGRAIVAALESDDYARQARIIELDASITAVDFYMKLGYAHRSGKAELDANLLYPMTKATGSQPLLYKA